MTKPPRTTNKIAPLQTDFVDLLIERAEKDDNARVRREAVFSLSQQRLDARAAVFLARLLNDSAVADAGLKKGAHVARKHHDPGYRKAVDERAREAACARHAVPTQFREPESVPTPCKE